jgi:hypothetical protein
MGVHVLRLISLIAIKPICSSLIFLLLCRIETMMSKEHALLLSGSGLENHDSSLDDNGMPTEDTNDDSEPLCEPFGEHAVQLLAICANFPISKIIGYDWQHTRCIYVQREGEVQEVYTKF